SILENGIASHARWKYRLFDAINTGKSEWTVQGVRTADQCEFGMMLLSLSPTEQSSQYYAKVRDLHAEFHQAAADVLELALAGRKQEAEKAIALGSRFTLVSSELTMTLSAWKDSVGQ
ncbi:MAG: CZB domain-containing protein, partial [Pirellulales bacterium]|nr:CZB domain-containing protein [Pirellulales bacterium]